MLFNISYLLWVPSVFKKGRRMNILKTSYLIFILLILPITTYAQVTLPPDKDQLLKGDAVGQTLVAEKNGYPSPQSIVSFKDQLILSKDQLRKINELITNLPFSVTVKGQEIIDAEEELNQLFESGNINEKTLRAKLERIGKMRADLRFMHLQVYLKEKQILNAKQWDRLKELQSSEVK
jgi:Spy/CpxP family protein refolding chaperone